MSADYQLEAEREMWDAAASVDRSSTQRAGYRRLTARYAGRCDSCAREVAKGETILYNRRHKLRLLCLECGARADAGEKLENNAPPRMTTRERLEAKAERRREWADSRSSAADATARRADELASVIPFGQPVHGVRDRNYRDRIGATMTRALEHAQMAEHHETAAAGIERALSQSIYDDDPDALEQLEHRIAELEAQRERIKAYNALRRKRKNDEQVAADMDAAELDEKQRVSLLTCLQFQSYACRYSSFPAYELQNLGGNINRQRQRLERLRRQKGA